MPELQDLVLREARLEDAKQIWQNIYPSKTLQQIENRIKNLSEHKKRIVAELNGKIVGYVVLVFRTVPHAHSALLHSLFVNEKFRNKGIGSKIIEYAEKLSLQNGIEILLLEVTPENLNAINLYKKLGFGQYGLMEKGYKKSGVYKNVVLMKKEIQK